MASSGYSDEGIFESIWDTAIATARFDYLNARIGEVLNFIITGDGSMDITDTKVTLVLRHISDEIIVRMLALAKVEKHVNPWEFLPVLSINNIRRTYATELQQIATTLGQTDVVEFSNLSGFGASNTL